MSTKEIVHTLSAPIRNLVLAATKDAGSSIFGASEKDEAEVKAWIEKAGKEDVRSEEGVKTLDSHLLSRTYLVSNYLTAADIAIYGAVYPLISKETPEQYYAHPSLTRFFDYIQTRPQIRAAADSLDPPLSIVSIDVDHAPKPVRNAEPAKKKEKATKAGEVAADAAAVKEEKPAAAAPAQQKEGKKEKKDKEAKPKKEAAEGGKKGGKAAAPAAAEPSVPVPSMIDLRVGHIVDVKKHPDADGLYVEQIDVGEETPRTVVSGLVNYIPIEQMQDKWLIVVCNLKPANMRGVKSHAMVLCASHKDGKDAGIEIVDPPKGSKPGERIYFEGFEDDKALDQLNPKKKIFETIQPGFTTLEGREAAWVDPVTKSVHRIRTKDGVCTAPSFVGASLS
ncbi:hypothetical protein M422DRAFT_24595 [Sphaerobolus stellatus SS14]|nr:hypothetical protein M422DRAFT_24595 [Sphaerobolus stellatus SS14]